MKKLLAFILFIFVVFGCSKDVKRTYSTDSERVFLRITQNTTESELTTIAQEFKEKKNIDVDFSASTFDTDGVIKDLHLKVDCNDGYVGVAETTALLLKTKHSGFARNYAEHAKSPFVIGAM